MESTVTLGAACSPLNGEIEADSLCLNTSFAPNILIFLFECLIRFGVLPFLFSWGSRLGVITWLVAAGHPCSWRAERRTRCFKLTAGERGRQGLGMDGGVLKSGSPETHFPQTTFFPFLSHPNTFGACLGRGMQPEPRCPLFFPSWTTPGRALRRSPPSPLPREHRCSCVRGPSGFWGVSVGQRAGLPLISGRCCENPTLPKLIPPRKGPCMCLIPH